MPSINKTKSGERFRAPTDQVRKMDRKRENKRNKRDRQQIRQAMAKYCNLEETTSKLLVLERQILGLDPQPFHIDVLKKKQKVLTDLINKRRVALQQAKEDDELKKFNEKLHAYHSDCRKLAVLADQVRLAQETMPDSIPLPAADIGGSREDRNLQLLGPSMTKKKVDFQLPTRTARSNLKPPGPPCGIPPDFSDSEDEDQDDGAHFDEDNLEPVPIPDFDSHRPVYPPQVYRNGPSFNPHGSSRMHPYQNQQYNPMGFSSSSHHHPHHQDDNAVISSAPQINRSSGPGSSSVGGAREAPAPAIVSAAPELRNLRKETVKLVPAQLMRKTEVKSTIRPVPTKRRPEAQQAKSTDEAYNDFMKELDGLI